MSTRSKLLQLLANGKFHSGTGMGQALNISRAAVCKAIQALCEEGLDIDRVKGRGYRLRQPCMLLDKQRIVEQLPIDAGKVLEIEVLEEVTSTNHYLLAKSNISGAVCLAEMQKQGRGRRGRTWIASPYSNIMLSMAWQFSAGPSVVSGLSLAAGVAVVGALRAYGVEGAGLKWPNDVLWQGRKLAGLLIDVRGEAAGPCQVVVGLGMNVCMQTRDAARIDQPWVDLQEIVGAPVDRNRLAALLIHSLKNMFTQFAASGLASFLPAWHQAHLFADKSVCLIQGEAKFYGVVQGVDADGRLLVRNQHGQVQAFASGDVSARLQT